jgi:tetratricopeptide (TPR) repeat protein
MSFSLTDQPGQSPAVNTTRLKRQLTEQAIDAAAQGDWTVAADINRRLLELGSSVESENRLAKALWEMGELAEAREHYQTALAIDPTNRIAERNIGRLRMLQAEAGKKITPSPQDSKAPVAIFIEETGKTGFAHLVDLPEPKKLAVVNPGDAVELSPDGPRLAAQSNGVHIGYVEPRVAARLLKLIADGNKYSAGVTSIGERDVRIIIRETYQDPSNYGKVSFPTAAKVSDLRPYTKGTLIREELELEDELELDEEDDDVEGIGRVVAADESDDATFVTADDDSEGDSDEDEEV